jgi:hypothetical protein
MFLLGCSTPKVVSLNSNINHYTIIEQVINQKNDFNDEDYITFEKEFEKIRDEIQNIPFRSWNEFDLYLSNRTRRIRDFEVYTSGHRLAFYYFHQMGIYARQKGYSPYVLRATSLSHSKQILAK